MTEFELKLEVPAHSLAAVRSSLRRGNTVTQRLRARYFDTADGLLEKHKVVVRLRLEGRSWVQAAKAPGGALLERLEHEVPVAAPAGGAAPAVDLARHAGTPAGDAILQALGLAPGDAFPQLSLAYETDVRREKRPVRTRGAVVELALDVGHIRAGNRSMPLCELELELKSGEPAALIRLAGRWCAKHALWLNPASKSMRGQRLAAGEASGPAVGADPPVIDAGAGGHGIAAAIVRSCLEQVLPNAGEVAGGTGTDEHVHQLRVGLRRLRTALRELQALAPDLDPAWEAPLAGVFRALGRQRDRQQLAAALLPQLQAAGGPPLSVPAAPAGARDTAMLVRTPAFQGALLELLAFTRSGSQGLARSQSLRLLRGRLQRLFGRVLKDGKHFQRLDDTQRHQVRKRLKRLRYLAQFCQPLFHPGRAPAFLDGLKPAQDALGSYNDEVVALQAMRELAAAQPEAWFAVGWLTARGPQRARSARRSLRALASLNPFWK
jgi:triphosphatase